MLHKETDYFSVAWLFILHFFFILSMATVPYNYSSSVQP